MKKVILTLAIALGSLTTFASTTTSLISNKSVVINAQDEFTEVDIASLPEAVKATATKSFPNSKLTKAYKSEKNEYKLVITMGDTTHEIITDANGNVIKK